MSRPKTTLMNINDRCSVMLSELWREITAKVTVLFQMGLATIVGAAISQHLASPEWYPVCRSDVSTTIRGPGNSYNLYIVGWPILKRVQDHRYWTQFHKYIYDSAAKAVCRPFYYAFPIIKLCMIFVSKPSWLKYCYRNGHRFLVPLKHGIVALQCKTGDMYLEIKTLLV